ncbi:hypothetical protein [Halarcobacter bivalviorum]|uniref:Lipoprotein n=1 Tax=Halarcobacter bivalviorum TaxID=663364 RepID=A0AAX2A8W1_9BACT|nr:hypothetical protein [Halarcobacter bivalviorum]AXH12375.1 hypothetical protein ABIV_1379 [Halarcobacter bivalviorum]RXK07834.1 hypothetical protein CRU97_00385 [Halarcobacter bivalviorum]RXK10697.1 hypothetical protein CRV05_05300 [Halarcobacter bivalviorum]
MKKLLLNLSIAATTALVFTACTGNNTPTPQSAAKVDEKALCSVEKNGIEKVLATAKLYNEAAKQNKLEFRRLEVNNSDLIIAVEEGIKSGAKEVNPKTFKGKKSKTVLPIEFAATRACKFGIAALSQAYEAKTTWRAAVPGDGFKY